MGITRLSLGTQSFRDIDCVSSGRAHNAQQALKSIEPIAKAGFESWTIDSDLRAAGDDHRGVGRTTQHSVEVGMPHLSAYCLTVEAKTALAHQVKKGAVQMPEDDDQSAQLDHSTERMEKAGPVHYEISNSVCSGHFSRHNNSYWEGVTYLDRTGGTFVQRNPPALECRQQCRVCQSYFQWHPTDQ
ncbi:MAG: hypothetical protein IPO87_13845 [Flavobacteriales bacterium]|nr:hypothetical protein [Flavobacteriales bacterium]